MTVDFTYFEKLAIVVVLSRIMEADGVLDPREIEFMDKVFAELGMTEDDMSRLAELEFNQCRDIVSAMADERKTQAVAYFEEMATCDGFFDPREKDVIDKLFS